MATDDDNDDDYDDDDDDNDDGCNDDGCNGDAYRLSSTGSQGKLMPKHSLPPHCWTQNLRGLTWQGHQKQGTCMRIFHPYGAASRMLVRRVRDELCISGTKNSTRSPRSPRDVHSQDMKKGLSIRTSLESSCDVIGRQQQN